MSSVKSHEQKNYKNELSTIRHHLEIINDDLRYVNVNDGAYIGGGCAAFLVKRFVKYNDIDIFIFSKFCNEEEEFELRGSKQDLAYTNYDFIASRKFEFTLFM